MVMFSIEYSEVQIFNAVESKPLSFGRLAGKVDKLRGWWSAKVTDTSGKRQEWSHPSALTGWGVTPVPVQAHMDHSGKNPPRVIPIDRRAKSSGLLLSPDGRRRVTVEGTGQGGDWRGEGREGKREFLGQFISY